MFDVGSHALETLMYEAVLASPVCGDRTARESACGTAIYRLPKICKASPRTRDNSSLNSTSAEFFSFRLVEKTFVVAVHEFLKATVGRANGRST